MSYMYAAIFIIAGLILLFQLSKENKIFFLAGGYFILMGGWWVVNALKPAWEVFSGVPGIVFKVITAIVLVICAAVFYKINRAERQKEKSGSDKKGS